LSLFGAHNWRNLPAIANRAGDVLLLLFHTVTTEFYCYSPLFEANIDLVVQLRTVNRDAEALLRRQAKKALRSPTPHVAMPIGKQLQRSHVHYVAHLEEM